MGVASRVADYAQIPALHEGRGMVAGRRVNVRIGNQFPARAAKAACVKSSHRAEGLSIDGAGVQPANRRPCAAEKARLWIERKALLVD